SRPPTTPVTQTALPEPRLQEDISRRLPHTCAPSQSALRGCNVKAWRHLAALSLITAVAGCGGQNAPSRPVIKMDGSSTVFPIAEAVAEEFQLGSDGSVRVTVGLSGTGGGFKKLCRGDAEITNASRPILTEEMAL